MKKITLIFAWLVLFASPLAAQKKDSFKLTNALVVAQQDALSDRYTVEGAVIQLFKKYGIKAVPSINRVKEGGSATVLIADSIVQQLKSEGIDTYLLISIRGYNKRFKLSETLPDIEEDISLRYLYPLYRESASNVTFTLTFYQDLKPVHQTLIRTGSVGSREAVMKKFMKKLEKKLQKEWL